jgi:hypothetical protein
LPRSPRGFVKQGYRSDYGIGLIESGWRQYMRPLRILCGLACLLLLASNIWSMLHWNEARGVFDDVCYLRQAHLFQRFGLGGLGTDISRDDDGYLASKLKEIAFPTPNDPTTAPCHTPIPPAGKMVIQYPPGTGLWLALFPEGHQVVPLYVTASIVVFGFALLGILSARTASSVASACALGLLAIYLMINPSKASYSMAPTMAVCAIAGFLTPRFVTASERSHRLSLAIALGLLLGASINFRLPNLFLASGYFVFFLVTFLASRRLATVAEGLCFGIAWLIGMAPTLLANAINAGSPFATTYGGHDVTPPDFSFAVVWKYIADLQFVLLLLGCAATAYVLRMRREEGTRHVAVIVAANLLVNIAFFMSHPVFTPYYTIPIAMLSLWSLLFATLPQAIEVVDDPLLEQAAKA